MKPFDLERPLPASLKYSVKKQDMKCVLGETLLMSAFHFSYK